MAKRIDAKNLNIYYGKFLAVSDVNLTIEPRSVTAFIGPSGCGKSTVLRTLNRMHEVIAGARVDGNVLLDGDDIYGANVDPVDVRRTIGMVFQRPNPFPTMSIYDNVAAGLKLQSGRQKRADLDNIVEKSLGSIVKSGSSPITGVPSPGEKARQKGMLFAATPASDFICGTLQLASGMTLQVFTTGRGTPYGLAAAPVIKVATRSELARRWKDLIDFDAGRIATGEKTIEETGWDLFRLILDVASGRTKPWSDRWGIHNDLTLFNPAPVT